MGLASDARVGSYQIVAALGAGGMGEVYRARDTRLNRDVALKILPEVFATDPERRARFEREAQVLASLNHPHIAQIYGIEEGPAEAGHYVRALVMELVEGETLADRIARGPIPIDEALPIARQIAEALEAAHGQGIIHRDLKPANIKLRPDGTVKVLDFGLAKLSQAVAGGGASSATLSPTITSPAPLTGVGMLLGTAAYMSPEQAKGKEADERSDIWAFGCVLYEMLTGRRAFPGEDVAETLAAVLRADLVWDTLPAATPSAVRRVLRRCLTRDRRQRAAAMADIRLDLEEAANRETAAEAAHVQARSWRRLAVVAIAASLGTLAITTVAWRSSRAQAVPQMTRTVLGLPDSHSLFISQTFRDFAVTADGGRLVYVGNSGTQLLVRSRDALEPVQIATGRPRDVFLSPDGEWAGYFDDGGSVLKKVPLTGGAPVVLTRLGASTARGAVWTPDGSIIFGAAGGGVASQGLRRVSADGGDSTTLTRPSAARGELRHCWPSLLPDGRVLFTVAYARQRGDIAILEPTSGQYQTIVRGGTHAIYVSGFLAYHDAGMLRAVRFDPKRLEVGSRSAVVLTGVVAKPEGAAAFAVTADGSLLYVRSSDGGAAFAGQNTVVWVDRAGREEAIPLMPRPYVAPRIAPDEARIALDNRGEDAGIWIWELQRPVLRRLTVELTGSIPVWAPNGTDLAFTVPTSGERNIFMQSVTSGRPPSRLIESTRQQIPTAFSPDGSQLLFYEVAPAGDRNLMTVDLGSGQVRTVLSTPADELNAVMAPNGRWLAYESNKSGGWEIYVRLVGSGDAEWLVSSAGGVRPVWTRGGAELVYLDTDNTLMSVRNDPAAPSWSGSSPTKLLDMNRYYTASVTTRTFDVSPDGQRFLVLKPAVPTAASGDIIFVQHWLSDLERVVPAS